MKWGKWAAWREHGLWGGSGLRRGIRGRSAEQARGGASSFSSPNLLSMLEQALAHRGRWQCSQPVSRTNSYDDLYQLRRVDYNYTTSSGNDSQVSAFDAEKNALDTQPVPEAPLTNRVRSQTVDFDWQGNLTKSDDDVHAFYDRSMGTIAHGTASNGPNRATGASADKGHASATYDAAGNLTGLTLEKPGSDGRALDLQFTYEWDEIGELVHARREPSFGDAAGVDFRYAYDANGQRVLKSVDASQTFGRVYSAEVFASLRLNLTQFDLASNDYMREDAFGVYETVYLVSGGTGLARVIYDADNKLPSADGKQQHVYFTMSDSQSCNSKRASIHR